MHQRKNIRLREYDYSSNGFYFVTVCCSVRASYLQQYHDKIEEVLSSLPLRFNGLLIDSFVIMPDHFHAILVFNDMGVQLGEVVRTFKALVSKSTGQSRLWQRNYYEHVIRNEQALGRIRKYISDNPQDEKIDFRKFYCS